MLEGFGMLQFLDTSWGESALTAMAHDPASEGWRGVRAASDVPGLTPVAGEVGPERLSFTGSESRDVWHRLSPGAYRWERSTRSPDGTWRLQLEAELTYVE